jgi:hypothetical protein
MVGEVVVLTQDQRAFVLDVLRDVPLSDALECLAELAQRKADTFQGRARDALILAATVLDADGDAFRRDGL